MLTSRFSSARRDASYFYSIDIYVLGPLQMYQLSISRMNKSLLRAGLRKIANDDDRVVWRHLRCTVTRTHANARSIGVVAFTAFLWPKTSVRKYREACIDIPTSAGVVRKKRPVAPTLPSDQPPDPSEKESAWRTLEQISRYLFSTAKVIPPCLAPTHPPLKQRN